MKKLVIAGLLLLFSALLFSGDVTVSLSGVNPITVSIKGTTVNEEAGSISIYLYYNDDATTVLETGNVDDTQLTDTWGWGTAFRTIEIQSGTYSKGGHSFTKRLYYDNAGNASLNDYWSTSGIAALVCTFTTLGDGHAYIEVNGSDGLADWSKTAHNVSYSNRDQSLPVEMTAITAVMNENNGVILQWHTASELDCAGFHVHRSDSEFGVYQRISNEMIVAQGNSSSASEYTFTDHNVISGTLYWYKIEEIAANGNSEFFGPIAVEGRIVFPGEFRLSQNFPNPFNPETFIEYDVPENSQVSVDVYNILGMKVKTLVNEVMEPGFYQISWNGTNDANHQVASGLYFIRMQGEGFVQIRKMMLQR